MASDTIRPEATPHAARRAPARPRGSSIKPPTRSRAADVLRLVAEKGGPGFCQFAVNTACNANCGFCNFARDVYPKDKWTFVGRQEGLDSIDILYREGIRYMVFTGGEPTLHPDLASFVRRASDLGMTAMVVTNAGLLKPERIHQLRDAGVSSFIISVDAADEALHEKNRGLPGVCARIRKANEILAGLDVHATASVTMSRLVDYDRLPEFLTSLGFTSVVFSYPLNYLPSNFLGYRDSDLVTYSEDELYQAYEKVKALKKRFRVTNPTPSLEEMQRFVRGEEQRYECFAGYRYFLLDWELNLWRCHHWHEPMCTIYEFDASKLVRDGCTACMINCYRDPSVLHHIGVSAHDAYQAFRRGEFKEGARALARPANLASIRGLLEEASWILRF